jgi:hypothetical protein
LQHSARPLTLLLKNSKWPWPRQPPSRTPRRLNFSFSNGERTEGRRHLYALTLPRITVTSMQGQITPAVIKADPEGLGIRKVNKCPIVVAFELAATCIKQKRTSQYGRARMWTGMRFSLSRCCRVELCLFYLCSATFRLNESTLSAGTFGEHN